MKHQTRTFIGFVIGFVGMELLVRALIPVLGDPIEYYAPVAQAKVTQLQALAQTGEEIDVVFVGSSTVLEGVDINSFEQASGLSAYNGALNAADTHVVRRFLLEEVLQAIHPQTVVYGISTGAFIESDAAQIGAYDTAPATRIEPLPWYKRVAEHLALYRYRNTLRDPEVVNTILRTVLHTSLNEGQIDRLVSDMTEHGDLPARVPSAGPGLPIDTSADLSVGPLEVPAESQRDIEEIARVLDDNGIELILVSMPYPTYDPGFAKAVRNLAKKVGAEFIDAAPAAPQTGLFHDGVHLNELGADFLSRFLADAMDAHVSDEDPAR